MQNTVVDLMKSHRSIRKFTAKPLSHEVQEKILTAAISASSSSFVQCVSIIRVVSKDKREKLVALTGNQPYVGNAAEFWVFCIDYARHQKIVPKGCYGYTEQVILGAVDAGIMGQNALLAAESLSLGGVFIGGIRNNPLEVCKLLELPCQVFPLMGLCLGYPEESPECKPRLPVDIFVHEDRYQSLDRDALDQYDQQVREYYKNRTNNKKDNSWSDDIEAKLAKEARPFMQNALKEQGFMTVI